MLTAREQRFVAAYLLHGNGLKAAVDAGYSPNGAKVQASRMLTRAAIKQAIANQRATFANPLVNPAHVDPAKIADATERREILTRHLRAATSEVAAARVADVLNRMDGLYVQKVDVTHHTKPDLSKLSDQELLALEQLVAKAAPVAAAVH